MNDEFDFSPAAPAALDEIYSVSRLTREVRALIEGEFGSIRIEGEISNFASPRSGHWYFSLKDTDSQVRCAMFKSSNRVVDFKPGDGMHVIARARVSMYEPRGEFQLIVQRLEPAGEGALRLRFEQLKRKLAAEGLFDEDNKFELPEWPNRIGVVTSPSGAALRDVLSVLKRRNPAIPVVIYPSSVQGVNAAAELVRAIQIANERDECDVLIVTRGGGSLEDLWPFNEEIVARAIFDSEIPVVSAVGHEIDFTIADLVADLRAPTPSASAEICSPHINEIANTIATLATRLLTPIKQRLRAEQRHLVNVSARLQHPGRRLEQHHQRVDELLQRLPAAVAMGLNIRKHRIMSLVSQVQSNSPKHQVSSFSDRTDAASRRLINATRAAINARQSSLDEYTRALNAVSPQATLQRGYAIVKDTRGAIARRARDYATGDEMTATLHEGELEITVSKVIDPTAK